LTHRSFAFNNNRNTGGKKGTTTNITKKREIGVMIGFVYCALNIKDRFCSVTSSSIIRLLASALPVSSATYDRIYEILVKLCKYVAEVK
jgi:hypothetical protein